ncbi:MAG: hypothetical protein HRU26_15835 [Psychroserpens sp.]|nr:hypothetical protein [Psychroserpens sp.]
MITNKKVSRYMAYAFGEIFLVMVGILLALQVNNWNEKRKLNKTIKNTFRTISTDLKADTTAAGHIIKFYETNNENSRKVFEGKFTSENYMDCMACFNLVTLYQPLNPQTKGIEQLKNIIDNQNNQVDILVVELTKFYGTFAPLITKSNNRMESIVMDNFKALQEKPWFTDMAVGNLTPEVVSYFTSSEDYKKRVAFHSILAAVNHLGLARQYKDNATQLLERIELRLQEE